MSSIPPARPAPGHKARADQGGGSRLPQPPTRLMGRRDGAITSSSSSSGPAPPSRTQSAAGPAHARTKSLLSAGGGPRAERPLPPTLARSSSSAARPSTRPSSLAAARAPARDPAPPRLRPAFSTLQQHYSPSKATGPKAATSTFLAPASPSRRPANLAVSAETSRLQTELLQLHLLHRDAAPTAAQWRASAREQLGRRFAHLCHAGRALAATERALAADANAAALHRWGSRGRPLEDKVQSLGDIVTQLWDLDQDRAAYDRLLTSFELWLDNVCSLHAARARPDAALPAIGEPLFIEPLDRRWKQEREALVRRLQDFKTRLADIDDLPSPSDGGEPGAEPSSGLERMLDGARTMIHLMLEELAAMEEMESEALAQESDWIQSVNSSLDHQDRLGAGAIWRTT